MDLTDASGPCSNRRSVLAVARTGAAGRGPIRALHLRGETVKRVSLIGAILAARCAEVSESEETFHGFAYQEGVVAWSSILSVVFRILLGAHLVAF
jgi:hypothetical protein